MTFMIFPPKLIYIRAFMCYTSDMGSYDIKEEFEFVRHGAIGHVKVFVNRLTYRAPHMHRDLEIDLVLAGECEISGKELDIAAKSGDIVLLNPNRMHEIRCKGKNVKILSLQISHQYTDFLGLPDPHFRSPLARQLVPNDEYLAMTENMCRATLNYYDEGDCDAMSCYANINAILAALLKYIPHRPTPSDEISNENSERIRKILAYLDKNFRKKVTLQDLGSHLYIAPQYLSHLFTKTFGISFRAYVSKLRLAHAVKLIDRTDIPLIDICYESGFSDYKYMEKMFLADFGCTPKNYRKNNRPTEMRDFKRTNEYIYSANEAEDIINEFLAEGSQTERKTAEKEYIHY